MKKEKECAHEGHKDIGMTMFEGFSAYVEWCPDCGAYRLSQNSGAYKNSDWNYPKKGR